MLHLLKKAPAMPALLLSSDSPKLREAYNRIRTNLDARLRGIACPVVGVSSPGEGEGAAACCENLAVSFARLGRRGVRRGGCASDLQASRFCRCR